MKVEKADGNVRPDLLLVTDRGKVLHIEIYVRHRVDPIKLEKLRERGISSVEIDLSQKEQHASGCRPPGRWHLLFAGGEVRPSPINYLIITERFSEFVVIIALMGAGLKQQGRRDSHACRG